MAGQAFDLPLAGVGRRPPHPQASIAAVGIVVVDDLGIVIGQVPADPLVDVLVQVVLLERAEQGQIVADQQAGAARSAAQ